MIGSIKVLSSMIKHQWKTKKNRAKYTYGNTDYGERESREQVYKMAQTMCRDMLKAAQTTLEVKGLENLSYKEPVLYVANHKSVFDIVILMSMLEEPCIFIGKKEVAQMPFAGKWFDDLGCIYIDREDIRQSLKAIMKGIEELKKGQSLVVFPEGTRSYTSEMKSFKEGSFKLATKTKVPIIPIALQNTYKILEEKKGIRKTTAYVNIGKTIYIEQLGEDEKRQLPQYVQGIVEKLLEEITLV